MPTKQSPPWHLAKNGKDLGTFTSQELSDMGKAGKITGDMVVWRNGMTNWQPVSKVKGLSVVPVPAAPPPPPKPAVAVAVVPTASGSRVPVSGHVTTEKTSKSLKAQYVISVAAILIGFIVMMVGLGGNEKGEPTTTFTVGGFTMFFAMVSAWITKLKIWWHHG